MAETVKPWYERNSAAEAGYGQGRQLQERGDTPSAHDGLPAGAMTKLRKAHVVTLSVVTAGLILVIGRETRWRLPSNASEALFAGSEESDQPTDTINRMMDAARDGDVDTYIECFGGQMKKTLQQSVAEMTASGFARYLMKNNEPIKGFAMYEPLGGVR